MSDTGPRKGQAVVAETPFDSIESAHEYISLLVTQVERVRASLAEDVAAATEEKRGRRLDALRLVEYKLNQLKHHLSAGGRILNDLRALRRLLLGERRSATTPVAVEVVNEDFSAELDQGSATTIRERVSS